MAEHLLAATRTDERLRTADSPSRHQERLRLRGQDVAMGWILAAMIAFGVAVGFAFPFLVAPLITPKAGDDDVFRIACVLAGFCVGGFAYGVARFTLYRANRRLACLAAYDGLTGLLNQREFARSLNAELLRAQRTGERATLIIGDLDHFKLVNDEHGHTVGDDVLAAVSTEITRCLRPYDLACRIGGEELAIILPRTSRNEGVDIAERIRARVEARRGDDLPAVTISCGVAGYPEDASVARELTRRADDAMYEAKAAGRNTVRAWRGRTDQPSRS